MRKSWYAPLAFSGLFLLSQAFSVPSPVRDAATGAWATGYTLQLPSLYILFAPFCGLADRLTLLSYHQAVVMIGYSIVILFWLKGRTRGAIALGVFIAFLAVVALVPRPMARLVAQDPATLLIDFHSHTQASHDGRPYFTPERNMRWHQAQGYGASFITDHNRINAAEEAKTISRADWSKTGYRSLQGEEISLLKTHLVVLGNHSRINNTPYDSDAAKIPMFIADMNQRKFPVIASLPEYWFYHWYGSPLGTIQELLRWDINGFEIINSAPRALDFPLAYRRHIVDLCKMNNLFMTGISDTHGYGYATAVWNAVRLSGWQLLDPDQLESAVIQTLQTQGFKAVQVLERLRYNPESQLGLFAAPWADAWFYWRSLHPAEAMSWAFWIWGYYLFAPRRRRLLL